MRSKIFAFFTAATFLLLPSLANAEVFCYVKSFSVNGYIYGMPALEDVRMTNNAPLNNISLCGDNCTDPATNQRLSIALAAQESGATLILYFGDIASCSDVTPYKRPFGMRIVR